MTSLVTTHHQWRHLLREMTRVQPVLRTLPQQVAQFVLASPVAIARWIATQRTDLMAKEELKILVAGVGRPDAVDAGAWYSNIPFLLSKPDLKLQLSFVGIEAGLSATTKIPLAGVRRWPIHTSTLEKFLEDNEPDFDLCFVFHPGFEANYRTWLGENNGLSKLTKANVQCVFASYAKDEYLMDVGYLNGFGMDGTQAVENPFRVEEADAGNTDTKYANYLWAMKPEIGEYNQEKGLAFAEKIDSASNLMAYFYKLNAKFGMPIDDNTNVGTMQKAASSLDDGDVYALLFRDVAIRVRDHQLYKLEENGVFAEKLGISADENAMASHPGKDASWMERIIWATDVWLNNVNPELQRRPLLAGTVLMGTDCKPDFGGIKQAMKSAGQEVNEEMMDSWSNALSGERHVMTEADKLVFNLLEQGRIESLIDQIGNNPMLAHAMNQQKQTIVYGAINYGRPDLLEAAIAAGADVNHKDNEGWTPLHHVSNQDGNPCLPVLVKTAGVRLDEYTSMGWPALLIAISHGCWNNALALTKAGASVHQPNATGMNAVDFAKQMNGVIPQELIAAILSVA